MYIHTYLHVCMYKNINASCCDFIHILQTAEPIKFRGFSHGCADGLYKVCTKPIDVFVNYDLMTTCDFV